jgi:hypothetical protein
MLPDVARAYPAARRMDFLLECIGFPPGADLEELARLLRREGEPVALRGPSGEHRRLPFPGGLELRLDREDGQEHDTLWPYFESSRRLRVALERFEPVPDSPFDVLLHGRANPPLPEDPWGDASDEEYPLACFLCDARRLPRTLRRGHVLAVSLAGFALDVGYVGPSAGGERARPQEPSEAILLPLTGRDQPGGCMELSLMVRAIHHLQNPMTRETIELVEAEAPGRPLDLFLSRWQLEAHGLPQPRPGWRIEGVFLFNGRLAGGLPKANTRR